jgi:zinc transporter
MPDPPPATIAVFMSAIAALLRPSRVRTPYAADAPRPIRAAAKRAPDLSQIRHAARPSCAGMTSPSGRRAERSPERFEVSDAPASGVICSFAFEDGVARPLQPPSLETAASGWVWTHLRLGDVRAVALVRGVAELPAEALALFVSKETRIQLGQTDGWVFGVLPDIERDLVGRPQGPGRLVFAFDRGRLITARLHALSAIDDLRRAVQQGENLASPAAAVVAHIELYADRAELLLEELGQQLAGIEDYVLTQPKSPRETELSGLRRTVARHRRELQALRRALARVHLGRRQGRRVSAFTEELPDLIAAVEDVDHDAGVLQDRGRLLHEEIDTLINSATNRSMRTLTILSTLLIPPTLITGAFGMNVPGIPFEHSPGGFAIAAALCALVVGAALFLLKRMGM